MNENNSQPPPIDPNPSTPPPSPFESLRSAWDRGRKDARDAAQEALPRIKSAAAEAAYWMTYGVSFAAAFNVTLARKWTPETMKKGFRDGAREGQSAADQFATRCSQAGKKPEPSTQEIQISLA